MIDWEWDCVAELVGKKMCRALVTRQRLRPQVVLSSMLLRRSNTFSQTSRTHPDVESIKRSSSFYLPPKPGGPPRPWKPGGPPNPPCGLNPGGGLNPGPDGARCCGPKPKPPGGGPLPDSYADVIWSIMLCALSCPSAGQRQHSA